MKERLDISEYADLDDEDMFGGDNVDVADLPAPREVLAGEREPMPEWLTRCDHCDVAPLRHHLASRTIFYPGSGADDHAIKLFGGTHVAHCFVHADWEYDSARVLAELRADSPARCKGYSPVHHLQLNAQDLADLLNLDMTHPVPGQDPRLQDALWVLLQREPDRTDSHGPARLALLHVKADAVWVYWNLWREGRARTPFAVVLQDHGFAGNWTRFGDPGRPLHRIASEGGLPDWILVARDTECWPGYVAVSNREPGGMYATPRRLARRAR